MAPGANAVRQKSILVMIRPSFGRRKVREELQNDVARDFDGHRGNAVKVIDQAIQQLQQGTQSAKH